MNFCRNCGASLASAGPGPDGVAGAPAPGPTQEPAGPRAQDDPPDPVGAPAGAPADNGTRASRRACPHCGAKTPVGFSFCQQCGKPLPTVSEAVRTGALISGETSGLDEGEGPAPGPGQPLEPAAGEPPVHPPARPAARTIPRASSRPGRPARQIAAMDGHAGAAPAGGTEAGGPEHLEARPGAGPGAVTQVEAAAPEQAAVQEQAAAQEPAWGVLIALEPDGTEGRRHPLAGDWIEVGRTQGDIQFADDRLLAPRHARIERNGDRYRIVSLDTANGVYRRLREPAMIEHGTMLLMGREVLRLELVDEDERTAPPLVRHGVVLFGSPPREPWGRLVQILPSGGIQDVRHLWTPAVTVGREEGDLVFPDDIFLSRRHATLSWREGRCVIEDLGSANGTFLRLPARAELHPGDHVRMGDQLFRFVIDPLP